MNSLLLLAAATLILLSAVSLTAQNTSDKLAIRTELDGNISHPGDTLELVWGGVRGDSIRIEYSDDGGGRWFPIAVLGTEYWKLRRDSAGPDARRGGE